MYKYLIPLYWIADLRVRTKPENDYTITPVCFSIDSETGLIVSYSFSYGLSQVDLHKLALLALRDRSARPVGPSQIFRSALGDLELAKRKLETDNYKLSLSRFRYPMPSTYQWSKAGALVEHFFYDWDYDFLRGLDNFRVISSEQLVILLDHVVDRFNRSVKSGDIDLRRY